MWAVACVYMPQFPLQVERARRPWLADTPLVLVSESKTVAALSAEAQRAGVRAGMPVRQAVALCGHLRALAFDGVAYREAWEALLESLDTVSPCIESPVEGVAFLDARGLPALKEGPQALMKAIEQALPARWTAQLGLAANKFVAYVAARRAQPGSPLWVGPDEAAAFLTFQPLEWVPASPEMHRRWRLLGWKTMGQLARLPRGALASQFGKAGERAWNLCRGHDDEPLRPRERVPILAERLSFSQPVVTRDGLIMACEQLVQALWRRRERQGRPVRQVRLRALMEGGGAWERTLTLKQATTDGQRVAFGLRSLLQASGPPGAVEELILEIVAFSQWIGSQGSLFPVRNEIRERLAEAVRELKARYGYSPISRLVEVEPWSRLPERRLALIDYEP